jgi:hypothetical protein
LANNYLTAIACFALVECVAGCEVHGAEAEAVTRSTEAAKAWNKELKKINGLRAKLGLPSCNERAPAEMVNVDGKAFSKNMGLGVVDLSRNPLSSAGVSALVGLIDVLRGRRLKTSLQALILKGVEGTADVQFTIETGERITFYV